MESYRGAYGTNSGSDPQIRIADELSADATTLFTIGDYAEAASLWGKSAYLFEGAGKMNRSVIALRARDTALEKLHASKRRSPSSSSRMDPSSPRDRSHQSWKQDWLANSTEILMDDMYGTGDIHRDAENDRHHHQEKKRVKGGLIVGRLTQAIDDMVEREVTERLETEYHARSDFAQQAHAAWVAHPEWGESERRLELDDYDEDQDTYGKVLSVGPRPTKGKREALT